MNQGSKIIDSLLSAVYRYYGKLSFLFSSSQFDQSILNGWY
jgi:hypothetical protein